MVDGRFEDSCGGPSEYFSVVVVFQKFCVHSSSRLYRRCETGGDGIYVQERHYPRLRIYSTNFNTDSISVRSRRRVTTLWFHSYIISRLTKVRPRATRPQSHHHYRPSYPISIICQSSIHMPSQSLFPHVRRSWLSIGNPIEPDIDLSL